MPDSHPPQAPLPVPVVLNNRQTFIPCTVERRVQLAMFSRHDGEDEASSILTLQFNASEEQCIVTLSVAKHTN